MPRRGGCGAGRALLRIRRRMECFDISTSQGSETVASMVVCEDGRMRRNEYRKYRIRGLRLEARGLKLETRGSGSARGGSPAASRQPPASTPDDFAAMHEVVLRRYRKAMEQGGP